VNLDDDIFLRAEVTKLVDYAIRIASSNLLNDLLLSCLLVGIITLDFMGKALDVVNQYYDLLNNKNFISLKDLLSENMSFIGPLVQRSGANEYLESLKQFFKFHNKSHMLK